MIDIKKDIDEVYLALEQAAGAFRRNGHSPSVNILDCFDCYALHLVENAKIIYLKNRKIVGEGETMKELED